MLAKNTLRYTVSRDLAGALATLHVVNRIILNIIISKVHNVKCAGSNKILLKKYTQTASQE